MARRRCTAIALESTVLIYKEEITAQMQLQQAAPMLLAALKDLVDEVRLDAATRTASMNARLDAAATAIASADYSRRHFSD